MKTRTTWLTVAGALAVVFAVMAWVTATLLRLDAEQARVEREGVFEEQARLALWRIDSAMTPILAREVALLDAPRRAALEPPPAGVVLRFELGPDGLTTLSEASPDRVAQLEAALDVDALFAKLEPGADATIAALATAESSRVEGTPYALKTQSLRNEDEWSRRRANAEDNLVAYGKLTPSSKSKSKSKSKSSSSELGERPSADGQIADGQVRGRRSPDEPTTVRPLWLGDELVLVRGLGAEASRRVQGTWLDWPALRALLLDDVTDLFPNAELAAVTDPAQARPERMLATLPARLVPGATITPPPTWSPLRASLVAAWVIVLAALIVVVVLVRASTLLSERRAAFVSAVTHELRTPLTTFRMYTEMLGEGMVEHKRERYVSILRRESDRLSGLVENVLAYAQIESDRSPKRALETMSAGLLVDRIVDRLRERCAAARMELELELREADREIGLRVDPGAVEQILFNLVDNAGKYAAAAEQARICLRLEPTPRAVELHVRDFGPGIAAADAKQVFAPFTKARIDAAGTKPGVGLGLALSRRLARQMGGDLRLDHAEPGADFVLTLARA